MSGAFVIVLLSVAIFHLCLGWVLHGLRPTLRDHVLAQEATRLEAHCAKLERTRDRLFDEVGQKRAELELLRLAGDSIIALDAAGAASVEQLLDDPPEPNAAMRELFELPPSSQGGN